MSSNLGRGLTPLKRSASGRPPGPRGAPSKLGAPQSMPPALGIVSERNACLTRGSTLPSMLATRSRFALVLALPAMLTLSVPSLASAACYQLFDQKDKLVLQSSTAPVDTSKPLSEEVNRMFPGHYLIVGGAGPCPEVDELHREQNIVRLPAESLNRGPIQIASESSPTVTRTLSGSASRPPPPTCYVGPRGGTYAVAKSGKKNYGGC